VDSPTLIHPPLRPLCRAALELHTLACSDLFLSYSLYLSVYVKVLTRIPHCRYYLERQETCETLDYDRDTTPVAHTHEI
jgi:hypothetical protein